MASLGYTYLSSDALREAKRQLFADKAGVRDEVGFQLIHTRYADRFFPGTSVVQTRLRYVLFICWILNQAREQRRSAAEFISEQEHVLTASLKGVGIIGGMTERKSSDQPISGIYWTALCRWGLVRPAPGGGFYARADLTRMIDAPRRRSREDEDGDPIWAAHWPVQPLPEPPTNFLHSKHSVSFELTRDERLHLRRSLRAVAAGEFGSGRSLLARLVGKPLDRTKPCWDQSVLEHAGSEIDALRRAGQAAALAAIGRGIYAALVEALRAREIATTGKDHRDALPDLIDDWRADATALDLDLFLGDVGAMPSPVSAAIEETHRWLRRGRKDPMPLLEVYRAAERFRKKRRARLDDTQDAFDRRREWVGAKHGEATPLHYRWSNVVRLLGDLR